MVFLITFLKSFAPRRVVENCWLEKCKDFCTWFGPKIDEYEKLITNNPIFRRRIEGLGTIGREEAINFAKENFGIIVEE